MEIRSVEAIANALSDHKVQYLAVDGLAVNAHGYERFTADVDLVIGLEPQNIVRGLQALLSIGYQISVPITPEQFADSARRQQWREEKDMAVLKLWSEVHRRTPVDVFVYEPFDFTREYAAAKWEQLSATVKIPFLSYETLMAMKRAAGRPQDLADISNLEDLRKLREGEHG